MSDSYSNTNTRADTLNQTAAHDSGIYDPNIRDNQLVAMYETEVRARAAKDTLVSSGVPEPSIQVTAGEQNRFADDRGHDHHESGLWGAIKSLFMPDEEAHGYAEGVRRGHAVLVVQPDATMDRHRIVELLESTDPVDFDAKLEEWRQAGYSYPGAATTGTVTAGATGAVMGTPPTTGLATDTSAMRATDTTAAGTFRNARSSSAREDGNNISSEQSGDRPGGDYEAVSESRRGAPGGTTATPPATSTLLPENVQRTRATPGATPAEPDETIKIVEERFQVGKREVVKGAVRVRSYVVERPVEQQVRLHEERVEVERHQVDRPVDIADDALFGERVIEGRATCEEAVLGKEARVVEELALHKEASERTETVRDTVRKTEVEIDGERNAAGGTRDAARAVGTTTATAGASDSGTNAPRK